MRIFENSTKRMVVFRAAPPFWGSGQGPCEVPMVAVFAHLGQAAMIRGAHSRGCDFSDRTMQIAIHAGYTELAEEMRSMNDSPPRQRASRDEASGQRDAKQIAFAELAKFGDDIAAFREALQEVDDEQDISDLAKAVALVADEKPNRARLFLEYFPRAYEVVIKHAADSGDLTRDGLGPIKAFLGLDIAAFAYEIVLRLLHARNFAGALAVLERYPQTLDPILMSAIFAFDAPDVFLALCPGDDPWPYVKLFGSVGISWLLAADFTIPIEDVEEIVARDHWPLLLALLKAGRLDHVDIMQICLEQDAFDCARAMIYADVPVTTEHRAFEASAAMRAVLALAPLDESQHQRNVVTRKLREAFEKSGVSDFGVDISSTRLQFDQLRAAVRYLINLCEKSQFPNWTLADESSIETANGTALIVATIGKDGTIKIRPIQYDKKGISILQANAAALSEGVTLIHDHWGALDARALAVFAHAIGGELRLRAPNADAGGMFPVESVQNAIKALVRGALTPGEAFARLKTCEFVLNSLLPVIGVTLAEAWLPGCVIESLVVGDSIARLRRLREGITCTDVVLHFQPDARELDFELVCDIFGRVRGGVGWNAITADLGPGRVLLQAVADNARARIPIHLPTFGEVTVHAIARTPDGYFAAFVFEQEKVVMMRTDDIWPFPTVWLATLTHLRDHGPRPRFVGFADGFGLFEYWSGPRIRVPVAELPLDQFNIQIVVEDDDPARTFDARIFGEDYDPARTFVVSVGDLLPDGRPEPAFASCAEFYDLATNAHVRFDPLTRTASLWFGPGEPTHPERRIPIGHAMEVSGAAAAIIRVAGINPALAEQLRVQLSRIRHQLGPSEAAQAVAVEFYADRLLGGAKPRAPRIAARMGLDADYVLRTAIAIARRGFDFCDVEMRMTPAWLPARRLYLAEFAEAHGDFEKWNELIVALDERISRLEKIEPVAGLKFDVRDALTFAGQAGIIESFLTRTRCHTAIFNRLRNAGFRVSKDVMRELIARLERMNVFEAFDE